jgi:hypothetical protein
MAGPFYIAWTDAGAAFDPVLHAREDVDIFELTLEQVEGDFATLAATVRNPRIGLLAPGRKVWAWFSWFDGAQIKPLFFGRLVGVPDQLQDETVQFNFIARPDDFTQQKAALAETMKVRPYWDAIWFSDDTRDDPDNVLESRPELWHTDRITHVVSASSIINGEDGTLSLDGSQVPYASVKLTYAQNALRKVNMTATVSWDQIGSGSVDLNCKLVSLTGGWTINSRTGQGLADDWPKPQGSIGGGWNWGDGTFCNIIGGVVDPSIVGAPKPDHSGYLDGGFDTGLGVWGIDWGANPNGGVIKWAYHVAIPMITLQCGLSLDYSATRRKSEVLTFTLETDVQSILTEPDDQETLDLTMSSSEVTSAIDPGGAVPLAGTARSYFATDRGAQSLEYLIAVARANLLARARAVNVAFDIPFPLAVASDLSCRKNAVITDPRLPGTVVGGKISHYTLAMSAGAMSATIEIGCSVGKGGTIEAQPGEPDYVEEDYVADDYQHYTGRFELPVPSDVAYEVQSGVAPNDDGIDFERITPDRVINSFTYGPDTSQTSQQDALALFNVSVSQDGQVTATNVTFDHFDISLKSLDGGPFETDYTPNLTQLKAPKTIDLEADAA